MFIDSGKVNFTRDKESPVIATREDLKKNNCSGLKKRRGRLDKKRELGLLILNRQLNNTQLLNNCDSRSKRFILFKLSIPKSNSINLAFLLTNLV